MPAAELAACLSFRVVPYVLEKEGQGIPKMQGSLCIKLWGKEYYINIMLTSDIASASERGVSLPLLFIQKTEHCYHKNTFTNECE